MAGRFFPLLLGAALSAACAGAGGRRAFAPPPAGTGDAAAREVLGRFTRALDAGRYDEAHALLSARWRLAYTPRRLALDFGGGGPAVREAAALVAQRLEGGTPFARDAAGTRLPVGGGRAAVLVFEEGGFRVDALE
jgi:hypothetical protein